HLKLPVSRERKTLSYREGRIKRATRTSYAKNYLTVPGKDWTIEENDKFAGLNN
ncbi:hypothetical protein M9458_008052, partial [Cirrhinus mrigala]